MTLLHQEARPAPITDADGVTAVDHHAARSETAPRPSEGVLPNTLGQLVHQLLVAARDLIEAPEGRESREGIRIRGYFVVAHDERLAACCFGPPPQFAA